jgi:DNA-binding CsgD family transcriptional regulator
MRGTISVSTSQDRQNSAQQRKDARIALVEAIRRDRNERGLSNAQIAEKHQISESSVRTLLRPDQDPKSFNFFNVFVRQVGTDNVISITVVAPKGTTHHEIAEGIRKSEY